MDFRNPGMIVSLLDDFSHLQVFMNKPVILGSFGKPARTP
jgi:hypothetical protein